ncbi:unnamed protein product [Urochloa decumbens]|uniref:Protein FAR1-RELATED SEQUENCE n=1 Tax=Urochloa decumbens TaxID=240449 RepID=A0ABC8VZP3_9POAL
MDGAAGQARAIATCNGARSRLVAMSGPCSRIPASPVSAIDRALRGADARVAGMSVFFPRPGTVFDSAAEAYQFYNLYSWDIGFGIRFGRSRTNSQNYRTRQDIGDGPEHLQTSQRTGCKAMIRLLRSDDHGWISQESIVDDIGKTLSLLRGMQSQDTNLAMCIDSDHEGRVRSILWCTGKNRADYALFGDAITFDTTYRTNLYDMPFGLFVGVNQHFQSTVFGGVLLRQETTASFEWAFSTFVAIMHGKAPLTMLTDQCAAMEAAIREVLPDTRHRWCRWHVLRKAKEKIGGVYSKYSGFKKEFHDVVTNVLDPVQFEAAWHELRRKYNLSSNAYLDRIYDRRHMWVKPYFRGVFCGGMTSTQRSESANHMLKTYIPRSAPMHMFVSRYQAMLSAMSAEEAKEDHVTKQKRRHIRIGVPVEWGAAGVYTRVMFDKLSLELYASGSFTVEASQSLGSFVVRRAVNNDGRSADGNNDAFDVKYALNSPTVKLECSCGLFDHMGMPCRHMLKVLVHQSATEIPPGNIHRRWTVAARSSSTNHPAIAGGIGLAADDVAGRKNLLYLAAMDLLHEGAVSVQGFEASMQALASAKHSLRVMAEDGYQFEQPISLASVGVQDGQAILENAVVEPDVVILPPNKVRSRGRPPSVRLKARADYYGSKRVKTRGIAECYVDDNPSVP